jgi:hypothetical protein
MSDKTIRLSRELSYHFYDLWNTCPITLYFIKNVIFIYYMIDQKSDNTVTALLEENWKISQIVSDIISIVL